VHKGKVQQIDAFKFKTGGFLKSRQLLFSFRTEDAGIIFAAI